MNICSALLSKFLKQYIQKVDKNQLNLSLANGSIELSNISFTENLLTSFGIPLLIKDSHAELIKVNFPLKNLKNVSAYFYMNNVDIYTTIEWSALNKVSINSIADLIQLIEDEKKAIKADKKKAWNSWIEKVIDNATIDVKNVRLHIEFTNWDKKKSLITVFFESLIMNTVDSHDEIIKLTKKPEILNKRIKLTSFSIALLTNAELFQNIKNKKQNEYNLLNQTSFTFKMIHNRNKSVISNSFNVIFDPISFSLSQDQYFALNHLFNEFSKNKIRQKFQICIKPLSQKKDNFYYLEMWRYLHRCAKKIRHPHKFSPEICIKFLKLKTEYAGKFMKQINKKLFVKNSVKKHGEELTFLLIQYTSILIRREERRIDLNEKEIDTISKDDVPFFSNDSVHFELNIQGICIELKSFLILSISNINCLYEKYKGNFEFHLKVKNCFMDDINSSNRIIQTNKDEDNFIQFQFHSKNDIAIFYVSKIKVDIQSSFLKKFCQFFINNQQSITQVQTMKKEEIEEKSVAVKSSSINQYLLKLNPQTFIKFKLLLNGISLGYTTSNDKKDQHSLYCEINKIELQNFSDESTKTVLNVLSTMMFGQIKVDDIIISEEFALKSSTAGIIDKYYFLDNIKTKFDVLNAKICFNSQIVDKISTILESINNNTQRNSTKVYSSHEINANVSSISILFNTGINDLILSISEVGLNPSILFKNVNIFEKDKEGKINIPSLCFDKWPIIETELINAKLNSYEFFNFFDEINWITSQVTKLINSFQTKNSEKIESNEEENDNFQLKAHLLDYKMRDRPNSIKFNNIALIIDENFNIKSESLSLFDSDNKQFLFCDDEINFIMKTSDEKNVISVNFPNLKMNFLWNDTNQIIDYFYDSRNLIEKNLLESNSKKSSIDLDEYTKSYQICIFIKESVIDIENSFTVLLDDLKFDYLISDKSSLLLTLTKIDVDNLLEVNNFSFNINDFIYDISISSINADLSQTKASKISNLSFIPNILNIINKNDTSSKSTSQFDMNLNINNFKFFESSTKLTLTIPIIKFTRNSYYSIGAIQIPSINFENLIFNNIEILMLYNSIDFKYENINSVFALERKKLLKESELNLTSLIIQLNSIEFDYAHYFVMRIFNAYKIYSKYAFLDSKESDSHFSISANINKIIIKEHNLSDSIYLLGLSYEQNEELTEFKCNSIECSKLLEMSEETKESDFFVFQKNASNTDLKINPINIYLNINTLKTLTYIYESLLSLIKTEFNEKINKEKTIEFSHKNKQNNVFNLDISGIQVHFSFEDDPLFREHGLIMSFNIQIEVKNNFYKLLNINNLNMFFKNYKKKIEFLPFIKDASFLLKIHDNNNAAIEQKDFDYSLLDIEVGNININLSTLDIFELQLIIDNIQKSCNSLFNPKVYSIPDVNKTEKRHFTVFESKITVKSISISLCDENRSSNLYNQMLTLIIETKSTHLLLHKDVSFSIDLIFTIMHMNSLYGKLEYFMQPTSFSIAYSKDESGLPDFKLLIEKGIEFNLTPISLQTLYKFINKFKNKDLVLIMKNESNINYKSKFWITNNLDDNLTIKYEVNGDQKQLYAAPNDHLPLCQYEEDILITFIYKDIQESFYPKNILFPTYFNSISISKIFKKNYIKSIEFNSPLSIHNKLDFKIYIFIKSDKQFIHYTTLLPKSKYPLPFEETQFFIVSDFDSNSDDKSKIEWSPKKKEFKAEKMIQIDQKNLPEIFSLSLNKSPKIIKIQNPENKKSISFLLNVNNDYQTNTRVYEIIPSIAIKNLHSMPVFAIIHFNEKEKDMMFLGIQEKRQINYFNHDIQSVSISLTDDIYKKKIPTIVKLDKENEIFASDDYYAIQVQKSLNKNQKQIIIFAPCALFNKTAETIYFQPSNLPNSKLKELKSNDLTFYGLESYTKSDKSMKIDISTEKSEKKLKAIDCMRLNSNCSTIYLPRKSNPKLFYPLNCSITLGDYPMNVTHAITFTSYLYVINNLPFDFSLIPVTSDEVNSIDSHYNDIDKLFKKIESAAQYLLKDCFYIVPHSKEKKENCVLIDCVPKNAMFLFSASKYPNNPIIQLNNITRTIFMVKNRKEIFYIELNICEDKSTLYATFQVPSFPVPLTINNSLKTPVFVRQNINPNKNELTVHADSSSLFAYTEPFINSKELQIKIYKNNKNEDESNQKEFVEFLFSMEEQLSPLISIDHNIIISTTIITKNNSKMIQIRYLDEPLKYQNNFHVRFSINSLQFSLKNKMSEIALLTMNDVVADASQDDVNTIFNVSIKSIQVDNQRTAEQNSVCFIGPGKNLINESMETKNGFFNLFSIFPRGVPLFSVVNFMSIQFQPIFIIPDPSLIFNLTSFVKNIFKKSSNNDKNEGSVIIEPSFNSVSVNKTLIAYFEICPVNVFIQIPTSENANENFLRSAAIRLLNMISMSKFEISIPKLFASEFSNNISYLFELYRNFYGNEIMNQVSKYSVIKMVASSLLRFKKMKFIPLSSSRMEEKQKSCDNRKPIFNCFNEIELKDLSEQTKHYFDQTPDVIQQLIKEDSTSLEISNFDKENQSNTNQNVDRLILGVKNDSNNSNFNLNNIDLIKIFQSNEIKRARIPIISPIYSSFNDSLNSEMKNELETKNENEKEIQDNSNALNILKKQSPDEIYLKIQTEMLRDKKLEKQNIEFIVESKTNEQLYCVTNEVILIFSIKNENIQILQKIELEKLNSVSSSGKIVSLKSDDQKIDQIDIEFNKEEDANTLVSFIITQQKMISLFGHVLSAS